MPRVLEGQLSSFYAGEVQEFAGAAIRNGLVEQTLRFGDLRVQLRFAGQELCAVLMGPLSGRVEERPGASEAQIDLWAGGDRAVPWAMADIGPAGLVRGSDAASVLAVHETGSGAVTLVDVQRRAILYRVQSPERVPWWERAAPLRTALFWALSGDDHHLVHSGAVGDERGGVLLAGASGSGKTTVALAALVHGLGYLADDYVLLHTSATGATAHAIYDTAKLDEAHRRRFVTLAPEVRLPPPADATEKAVIDVGRIMSGAVCDSLPVHGVVVPRICGGRTAVRALGAAEALLALGPSTVLQTPFDDGGVLRVLAELVRGVPCFALDVGDDVGGIAGGVERVLELVR